MIAQCARCSPHSPGDILPPIQEGTHALINYDVDAFMARVRECSCARDPHLDRSMDETDWA